MFETDRTVLAIARELAAARAAAAVAGEPRDDLLAKAACVARAWLRDNDPDAEPIADPADKFWPKAEDIHAVRRAAGGVGHALRLHAATCRLYRMPRNFGGDAGRLADEVVARDARRAAMESARDELARLALLLYGIREACPPPPKSGC